VEEAGGNERALEWNQLATLVKSGDYKIWNEINNRSKSCKKLFQ
jgi:hypothetical protein